MKLLRALFVVGTMLALSTPAFAQKGTVTCKDGTKSAGGRGACSSHGGVATMTKAAAKADAKAAKAEKKAEAKAAKEEKKAEAKPAKGDESVAQGAIAECKDHTYSHAKTHQGACSRHGGVARFLDGKK